MKTLPGLPALPAGHYWKVLVGRTGSHYCIELIAPPREGSTIPRVLNWDITRAWPQPGGRAIARTARKIHRRWVRQQALADSALVGTYRGGPA
jgi:hypothetical protein